MNHTGYTIESARLQKSPLCAPILRALPEWFGREDSIQSYIEDIDRMPTAVAYAGDDAIGFLTLNRHFEQSAEIHVMGVRPEWHRKGVGRALLTTVEAYLRTEGVRFLQVKTLGMNEPYETYAFTRAFYLGVGFIPLEAHKGLWGDFDVLQLVKYLAG
jgi:GNAT superfamily N-acetyltransferase